MLKLKDITVTGDIATMRVLINCREDKSYRLTLDMGGERFSVIETELPDDLLSYASQAMVILREYKDKDIPSSLTTAWY